MTAVGGRLRQKTVLEFSGGSGYERGEQIERKDSDGCGAQKINFYVANTHGEHNRKNDDEGEGSLLYMLITFCYTQPVIALPGALLVS
jgi:hypothetical protein